MSQLQEWHLRCSIILGLFMGSSYFNPRLTMNYSHMNIQFLNVELFAWQYNIARPQLAPINVKL